MQRILLLAGGLCLLTASPGLGLQLSPPPEWKWVTDRPARETSTPDRAGDSTFTFVRMPPGWHITMGPGGVLYDPRYFTDGPVTLESKIFHFPSSANNEYGFFIGGSDLEGGGGRHVAFVFRGDGSVAAWERSRSGTRMLADWRRAEAVLANDGTDIVRNVIRLVVSRREVVLRANGLDVLILPREGLDLEGQFGFRVGAGVNLHVATLDMTHRLAPERK